MRIQSIVALFLLAVSPSAALAAPPAIPARCPEATLAASGASVAHARLALVALPVGEMDTNVTPQASAAIERLKDRVQQAVRLTMGCAPRAATLATLRAMLAVSGAAHAAPEVPTRDMNGGGLEYAVEAVPGRPGWVAILPTIDIECGSDTMLMLFEPRGRGWREVISRRSKPYGTVAGGWQGFHYAVSPRDAAGDWYLVTSHTIPWCTSAWNGLRYDLSRPGTDPARPRIFFHTEKGIYLGNDDDPVPHAAAAWFEIRQTDASIDFDVFTRTHIERYAVRGDHVRRIQPVALNPRDFVDEWIVSPWAEAVSWSAHGSALAAAHARLNRLDKHAALSFGTIRGCRDASHQIEIRPTDAAPWYLNVSGKTAFTLRTVSRQASPRCRS